MQLAHMLDEMYLICLPEIEMVFSSIPGVSVELSYDSAQVKALSSSAVTEYRVTVTDKRRAYYVFQKPFVCRAGFNLPVTKKNRTSPRNAFLGFLDFFRFSQNNFGQNSEKKSSIQS